MEKLQKASIKDKKAVIRIDSDIDSQDDKLVDDYRLKAVLPTIKTILQKQPERIILLGHKGRPYIKAREEREEVKGNNPKLILRPIAKRLKELLNYQGEMEETKVDGFSAYRVSKDVYLLENIRFDYREKRNDDQLSKSLAQLGDLFVFDAFATSHRPHASTKGIQKFLPSYLGLRCQKEIKELNKLKEEPESPFIVLVGGVKIDDKQPVVVNLAKKADKVLIGGKVANSIYESRFSIHKKTDVKHLIENLEKEKLVKKRDDPVDEILTSDKIVLPRDGKLENGSMVEFKAIRQGTSHMIPEVRDIGPKAIEEYEKIVKKAKTVFWAGPMGMFEKEEFAKGTEALISAVKELDGKSYAAGGDTHRAIKRLKGLDAFDFLSVGGGAALDYLADKNLAVFSSNLFEK